MQYAQVKYLQDEIAALIVQGQFDSTTSRLFRNIQKNTSVFSTETLENLKSAASIAAAGAAYQQQTTRGRGRGGRGQRGGFFNRGRQQDYYAHATANRQFQQRQQSNNHNDFNEWGP